MRPLLIALMLVASPALAQHAGHERYGAPMTTDAAQTAPAGVTPRSAEATRAMGAINARMHSAMSAPMTGELDVDFVRGMIPHHQGAIEMAEHQLRYSTDPQIRTLARGIIGAQRREITFMRAWLKERGLSET